MLTLLLVSYGRLLLALWSWDTLSILDLDGLARNLTNWRIGSASGRVICSSLRWGGGLCAVGHVDG